MSFKCFRLSLILNLSLHLERVQMSSQSFFKWSCQLAKEKVIKASEPNAILMPIPSPIPPAISHFPFPNCQLCHSSSTSSSSVSRSRSSIHPSPTHSSPHPRLIPWQDKRSKSQLSTIVRRRSLSATVDTDANRCTTSGPMVVVGQGGTTGIQVTRWLLPILARTNANSSSRRRDLSKKWLSGWLLQHRRVSCWRIVALQSPSLWLWLCLWPSNRLWCSHFIRHII